MSTPHEEAWEWDAEAGEVVRPSGPRPTEVEPVDFSDEESGTLAAAAPNMARALVELVGIIEAIRNGEYTPDSFTGQSAIAALRKAGVPLP